MKELIFKIAFCGLALSLTSAGAIAESNGLAYYGQLDAAYNEGKLESDDAMMKNERRYASYGAAVGAAFNPSIAIDAFYHAGTIFDIREYGLRLNFRKVMTGELYGLVNVGFSQTSFTGNYNKLNQKIKSVDVDTGVKPLFNIGAGYRLNQKINLEASYGLTGNVPRVGTSLIYRFN